jgi:hypothetical protein
MGEAIRKVDRSKCPGLRRSYSRRRRCARTTRAPSPGPLAGDRVVCADRTKLAPGALPGVGRSGRVSSVPPFEVCDSRLAVVAPAECPGSWRSHSRYRLPRTREYAGGSRMLLPRARRICPGSWRSYSRHRVPLGSPGQYQAWYVGTEYVSCARQSGCHCPSRNVCPGSGRSLTPPMSLRDAPEPDRAHEALDRSMLSAFGVMPVAWPWRPRRPRHGWAGRRPVASR